MHPVIVDHRDRHEAGTRHPFLIEHERSDPLHLVFREGRGRAFLHIDVNLMLHGDHPSWLPCHRLR